MSVVSETGAQLFARLGEKPSLDVLAPQLFGPELYPVPGDVVEIYGTSGSGKTEFLLNVAATSILPQSWQGASIGGLGVGAVFIDTDHQFCMLRLYDIMEKRVLKALQRQNSSKGSNISPSCNNSRTDVDSSKISTSLTKLPSEDEIESFLKCCLKRLNVVQVKSREQLVITLYSLESLLASQTISLILIDTISAFYWIDKMKDGAPQSTNQRLSFSSSTNQRSSLSGLANQRAAFSILSKLLNDYHIVAFATKAALVSSRTSHDSGLDEESVHTASSVASVSPQFSTEHCEFMSLDWTKIVSHRIILERQESIASQKPTFVSCLKHRSSGSSSLRQFSISDCGIDL